MNKKIKKYITYINLLFLFYLNNAVYSINSIIKVYVYLYMCMNNIINDFNKFNVINLN